MRSVFFNLKLIATDASLVYTTEMLVNPTLVGRMTQGFTVASAAELLRELMVQWQEALQVTIETGYWQDTIACDRIVVEYGNLIAEALQSGKFSGDSRQALEFWLNLTSMEAENRREETEIVRRGTPAPDPSCWWMVLGCHPRATPDEFRKMFREKMKECHPDRVAGLAPEIRGLANDMAQRLNGAMQSFEATHRG